MYVFFKVFLLYLITLSKLTIDDAKLKTNLNGGFARLVPSCWKATWVHQDCIRGLIEFVICPQLVKGAFVFNHSNFSPSIIKMAPQRRRALRDPF